MRYPLVLEGAKAALPTTPAWIDISHDWAPEYMARTQRKEKVEAGHAIPTGVLYSERRGEHYRDRQWEASKISHILRYHYLALPHHSAIWDSRNGYAYYVAYPELIRS